MRDFADGMLQWFVSVAAGVVVTAVAGEVAGCVTLLLLMAILFDLFNG